MARQKKEKSLLERVIAREEVDLTQFSIQEIHKLVRDLVELQENRIRKDEILKLQGIVIKASEKIKEILEREK